MAREQFITKDNARELQKKGVQKRKENAVQNKVVAEAVMEKLMLPVKEGSSQTKLEWLVQKALENVKDDVTLQDLQRLQDLLGEKTVNNIVNLQSTKSAEDCAKDILKEIGE